MACVPRTLLARPGGVFVLLALFGALEFHQSRFSGSRGPSPSDRRRNLPPPPSSLDVSQLPIDRESQKKLETAHEYIKAKSWAEVAHLLQAVLDRKEDGFLHIPADGVTKSAERWSSTRTEADRLLAALPAAGIEYYQVAYNEPAQKMLAEAKARRDPQAVRRDRPPLPLHQARREALELLGSHALDRGEFEQAAVCYHRLLERLGKEKPAKATLFKAVVAFHCAGNRVLEQQTLQQLVNEIGNNDLKVGGNKITAEQLRQEIVALADRRGASRIVRSCAATAAVPGSAPASSLIWTRWCAWPPSKKPPARIGWSWRSSRPRQGSAILPAATPIGVGDRLFYRSALGVHALDAKTGKELWRTRSPLGLDSIVRDRTTSHNGKYVQLEDWFMRRYVTMRTAPVRKLNARHAQQRRQQGIRHRRPAAAAVPAADSDGSTGPEALFGPLKDAIYHNKLRALDVATGAVVWEAGGMKTRRPRSG